MGKSILCLKWCKADESVDKRKVVVSDLPSGVSKDSIQLYFESKNNNGGPVEEVEYEIGDETALVTFQESEGYYLLLLNHYITEKRFLVLQLRHFIHNTHIFITLDSNKASGAMLEGCGLNMP